MSFIPVKEKPGTFLDTETGQEWTLLDFQPPRRTMSTNVSVTVTLTRGQWRILRALCERLLSEPISEDAARVVRRVLDRVPT